MRVEINISNNEARRMKWLLEMRYGKSKRVKLETLVLRAARAETTKEAKKVLTESSIKL